MALNHFVCMGRLTAAPELKQTQAGKTVTTFTLAVDRNSKEKQTDFLNCVAWEKTAEMICKWFSKGSMICIEGSVQTRSWQTQDGQKRYATEIIVDRVHFTGEKSNAVVEQNLGTTDGQKYVEVETDADLPF